MIANITGLPWDLSSRWQKKIISSTSNKMLVEFQSDDLNEWIGFSASIHYLPLPRKECQKGLDMTKKTMQSPNYPDFYDNYLACKWLISVPHGSHITLKFLEFDVRFLIIRLNFDLQSKRFYCLFTTAGRY